MSERIIKAGRPSGETGVTQKLLDQVVPREEKIRVTLDLPVELHTKLKLHATKNRATIVDTVKNLIKALP